jgi:geranylgeranyl reductase
MYDLAIVGGGPAGATLARLLGRQYKVLLLERRTFEKPLYAGLQKCCGGLLDPDAQKMLASFGLGLPKSVILSPQMFAVRTIDHDNRIERYYQRHYVNIDREAFDQWLESIIPPAVEIRNGSLYRSHEEDKDFVKIRFSKGNKDYIEKAKILVGADGAFSKVRRASFPSRNAPKIYVAIQEWFENTRKVNYYGAIFDREITDFYSWLIPKENYLIVGSALFPNRDIHKNFALLKLRLKEDGFEFQKSIRKNGAYLLRPLAVDQIQIGSGRIALIGEAAGFISPSSAEGISYAFKSALALAGALAQGMEVWHELYKKNTAKLRRNILLKNFKVPFMYNRILRKYVMKSGLKSIGMNVGNY